MIFGSLSGIIEEVPDGRGPLLAMPFIRVILNSSAIGGTGKKKGRWSQFLVCITGRLTRRIWRPG